MKFPRKFPNLLYFNNEKDQPRNNPDLNPIDNLFRILGDNFYVWILKQWPCINLKEDCDKHGKQLTVKH